MKKGAVQLTRGTSQKGSKGPGKRGNAEQPETDKGTREEEPGFEAFRNN